tara:strand:- start:764 stop:2581 length:1818 start_codon:yes stop_codon:yes gene_type:complete
MSHLLNSGSVGNIGLNHMKDVRKKVQEKWDTTGFLTGLQGHVKENVAQLFENQAGSLLTESTDAASSGSFETVVFPIVRRVFSKLLANDIVSVQAMNLPIGKLFFFVPITSSRVDAAGNAGDPYGPTSTYDLGPSGTAFSAHTSMAAEQLPTCVAGSCTDTAFQAKNLYDLFYNDGMFDNSKGALTIQFHQSAPKFKLVNGEMTMITTALEVLATATDGTVREVILGVSGFTSAGKGQLTGPDGNEMDSESFLASMKVMAGTEITDPNGAVIATTGSSVPFRVVTQKYGKGIVDYTSICDAAGIIYIGLDLTHPVDINAATTTFDGYIGMSGASLSVASGTTFMVAWAQYATLELETEMGEVSFRLDDVVVSVEERKLRATWSPELAQDVSAFHNIDAEAELTALLSEQVASEIDREILRDLRKLGAWQMRWDYYGWRKASLASNAYTQKDWNQTLITKVNQISAQIHKSTLRGGANFIVVSSEISAIFDDLEYFHVSDASPDQDQYNMGIERIGSLGGRYQVYRDPYAPSYSMIIGHKGKSLLDTGYIYAPYVPMQLTPTMYNPFNFAPVKGIMTRYAKKSVNNRFYGHVRVDGVPTFNVNELR